jgi:DNA-binding MarR family transcriptional regulator
MNTSCHCVALRRATRKISAFYDEALAPAGINLAQFSLLSTISRHAPVSLTRLGELTELDRSTVGRNVRVLERAGLAEMATGRDQREATVRLSTSGVRTLEAAIPLWAKVQERMESTLGGGGIWALHSLLDTITSGMEPAS